MSNPSIECPYCGTNNDEYTGAHRMPGYNNPHTLDCWNCDRSFIVRVSYTSNTLEQEEEENSIVSYLSQEHE